MLVECNLIESDNFLFLSQKIPSNEKIFPFVREVSRYKPVIELKASQASGQEIKYITNLFIIMKKRFTYPISRVLTNFKHMETWSYSSFTYMHVITTDVTRFAKNLPLDTFIASTVAFVHLNNDFISMNLWAVLVISVNTPNITGVFLNEATTETIAYFALKDGKHTFTVNRNMYRKFYRKKIFFEFNDNFSSRIEAVYITSVKVQKKGENYFFETDTRIYTALNLFLSEFNVSSCDVYDYEYQISFQGAFRIKLNFTYSRALVKKLCYATIKYLDLTFDITLPHDIESFFSIHKNTRSDLVHLTGSIFLHVAPNKTNLVKQHIQKTIVEAEMTHLIYAVEHELQPLTKFKKDLTVGQCSISINSEESINEMQFDALEKQGGDKISRFDGGSQLIILSTYGLPTSVLNVTAKSYSVYVLCYSHIQFDAQLPKKYGVYQSTLAVYEGYKFDLRLRARGRELDFKVSAVDEQGVDFPFRHQRKKNEFTIYIDRSAKFFIYIIFSQDKRRYIKEYFISTIGNFYNKPNPRVQYLFERLMPLKTVQFFKQIFYKNVEFQCKQLKSWPIEHLSAVKSHSDLLTCIVDIPTNLPKDSVNKITVEITLMSGVIVFRSEIFLVFASPSFQQKYIDVNYDESWNYIDKKYQTTEKKFTSVIFLDDKKDRKYSIASATLPNYFILLFLLLPSNGIINKTRNSIHLYC